MHKAALVSSPSHALLEHLEGEFEPTAAAVFKNPMDESIRMWDVADKEWDVVFLGRFQTLKGVEYINPILAGLPKSARAVLIGRGASQHTLSPDIKCYVERHEHIEGPERLNYVGRSKVLLLLSKFENCSMVILEALASGTVVHCWNVGGNAEIANEPVLHAFDFEDINSMVSRVCEVISNTYVYPGRAAFRVAQNLICQDFERGINSVVARLVKRRQWGALDFREGLKAQSSHIFDAERLRGKRVLGFSISSEHIQEMWEPVVRALDMDRRYVSLRERGHRKFFDVAWDIEDKAYATFDWIKHTDRLIKNIQNFKPDFLLMHNGLHPRYQLALKKIKALGLPIVYTELGWFPQSEHIYFDEWGTNGASKLASLSFKALCGYELPTRAGNQLRLKKTALVALQLENDTNLIVNSPLFKSNENFLASVVAQIPEDWRIVVRPHPLDVNRKIYEKFASERLSIDSSGSIEEVLAEIGAVIALNSTVLLQALAYPINIYSLGRSLLDNKDVAICCSDGDLARRWQDVLSTDMDHRRAVMEAFRSRQINVQTIGRLSKDEMARKIGLQPLSNAVSRKFQWSEVKKIVAAGVNKELNKKEMVVPVSKPAAVVPAPIMNQVSSRQRKLRKLRRDPVLFFKDLKFIKLFRSLGAKQ
ncbi:glycosyltransferase [Cupriavidus sp. amp6]|uniref:glycosyltransferase n=1 Tax=Cupriavidus sp. amp6 TaxID=388051 RepID=UPI0018DC63AC|nr:glycosyltransferase [Cupriavidus sp. amp6]